MTALGLMWLSLTGLALAEEMSTAIPTEALAPVRHLAIQHNGRLKPFESFARETLDLLAGSPRWQGEDPVETVLSIIAWPDEWEDTKIIEVPFVPLRDPLGMDRQATHTSYAELVSTRNLMRMLPPIVAKQQRNEQLTMLESETLDVFTRFTAFHGLIQQDLRLVPSARPGEAVWQPVLDTGLRDAWTALVMACQRRDAEGIRQQAIRLTDDARRVNPQASPAPWRLRLEVLYHRAAPFGMARLLYGLAALALMAGLVWARSRLTALGITLALIGFLVHGAGIAVRVILGGRPPVSNFYETMLWLPFVAVLLALIFDRIYRAGHFTCAAAILATITLTLADLLPLDPSISPVVAVLRSNLWLTVHVLTIVASYGALALATGLAHIYGAAYLAGRGRQASHEALEIFLYRAIQVGVVLLAGGIMLGAVWANASWGRYWGWDPKETWALITLLWFVTILHGRFAGWLKGVGIALGTIAGFFLLLITYYGVSFYLVGLHSYAGGHAKPLPPLLVLYLVAELMFMAAVGWSARLPRDLAGGQARASRRMA